MSLCTALKADLAAHDSPNVAPLVVADDKAAPSHPRCAAARALVNKVSTRSAVKGGCPLSNLSHCTALKARLAAHDNLKFDRALLLDRVAWQLASGLNHVHAAGMTHFDIAPDNIIVTPGLDVYITDFGTSSSDGVMGKSNQHVAPCEHKENSPCSLKDDKFPIYPPCAAVDTYELAVTLTMMYSGIGLHESLGVRYPDGPKEERFGYGWLFDPIMNKCGPSKYPKNSEYPEMSTKSM